jgi:hypothetical protein
MKTSYSLFGTLILSLAVSLQAAAEPNTLTAAERSSGWTLLFDGRSLAGWRGYRSATPGANWKVIDGALVATLPKSGDLLTTETFGDFELSIEWRIAEAGNGGILYRVGIDETRSHETGPEYQLLDNQKARGREFPTRRAGALYDLIAPATDTAKPAGAWNETRIVIRGWRIEHWLNGAKLVACDLAGAEGKALIAASKFGQMAKFAALSRGHIALQDYGNEVSFRAIKIRELP